MADRRRPIAVCLSGMVVDHGRSTMDHGFLILVERIPINTKKRMPGYRISAFLQSVVGGQWSVVHGHHTNRPPYRNTSLIRLRRVAQIWLHNIQPFRKLLLCIFRAYCGYDDHVFAVFPICRCGYGIVSCQLE